jgi:DGQHR domain-containing protein
MGNQYGRKILVGVIPVGTYVYLYQKGLIKIDKFSKENPQGYQRDLVETRARRFSKFVRDQRTGISPNPILLYNRSGNSVVKKDEQGYYIDEEALKEEAKRLGMVDTTLFIADGQHRSYGYSYAHDQGWIEDTYEIPFSMLMYDPQKTPRDARYEEALQFYTINQQSQRMRTDLAQDFLKKKREEEKGAITEDTKIDMNEKKKDLVPYAVFIARQMEERGILAGKISPPNTNIEGATIKEGSFTRSLEPILDYIQKSNITLGEAREILENFWTAVGRLCPIAFEDPSYVLLKTSGIFSLHKLLPTLLFRNHKWEVVPSVDDFERVLSKAEAGVFTDEFWSTDKEESATLARSATLFGTSAKSFNELYLYIVENLYGE